MPPAILIGWPGACSCDTDRISADVRQPFLWRSEKESRHDGRTGLRAKTHGMMNVMALGHAKFRSYRSYHRFRRATMRQTRYALSAESQAFLETVKDTATDRVRVLAADERLWRAQLGCRDSDTDGKPVPYKRKRMKPLPERAQEGRANPKGIPYLYLATDRDTAIGEVRPWVGSYVSVCRFTIRKELRLVDCTKDEQPYKRYRKEPRPEIREEAVWSSISRAFSKPVNPCDDIADYVPTQIIAEFLKTHGYDGIEYRSSLGKGHNIVLFDLSLAEPGTCYLFQVKTVSFASKDTGKRYPPAAAPLHLRDR